MDNSKPTLFKFKLNIKSIEYIRQKQKLGKKAVIRSFGSAYSILINK